MLNILLQYSFCDRGVAPNIFIASAPAWSAGGAIAYIHMLPLHPTVLQAGQPVHACRSRFCAQTPSWRPSYEGCVDADVDCHTRALGNGCSDPATAAACALSCGSCPALRSKRYALVTFVCNNSAAGDDAGAHLLHALNLASELRRHGSAVPTVAIAHGYGADAMHALARAGYRVRDVSTQVDPERLMRPIGSLAAGKAGKHWPRVMRRTNVRFSETVEMRVREATTVAALHAATRNLSVKNYLGGGAFSSWGKFWELPRHMDRAGTCTREESAMDWGPSV